MELSPEFHGTFWTTFEQHPWFHGIPWNLSNKTSSSMEFHGILSRCKVPWNSMELFPYSRVPSNSMEFHGTFNFPQKSSVEFHGTFLKFYGIPWNLNFIFKKIIFLNIVYGIWLMIRCYLAKISQKLEQQNLKFHGIPWNFVQMQSSMEFHGTFSILSSSMEFHGIYLKFHGIPWKSMELEFHI